MTENLSNSTNRKGSFNINRLRNLCWKSDINKGKRKSADEEESQQSDRIGSSLSPIVSMRREIGFISCLGMLVGTVIGSGIFIAPQGVLGGCGSIGLTLIMWVLCGLITLTGSMVYAELGMLLPNSGGIYYYLMAAFDPNRKKEKSFWPSLIPFLYFWQYSFIIRPCIAALQGIATAQYMLSLAFYGECSLINKKHVEVFIKLVAALIIVLITALNCHSNKLSTKIVNVLTIMKLLPIGFIIISGCMKLSFGSNAALQTGFEGTTFGDLASAYYSGSWSYSGSHRLTEIAREMKNPKRDMQRSMVIACITVTLIYLLVNVSYFAVMSKEGFLSSQAIAVDFADIIAGKYGVIFMVTSVSISIFGSILGSNLAGNRVLYAAAREGHMLEVVSFIHYKSMTPRTALILNGIVALLLLPNASILGLLRLYGFLSAIFAFWTVVALLILRKNKKRNEENFQVPFIFILINFATSVAFVIEPFLSKPKIELIVVMLFMLLGVAVYAIFVHYKITLPGLRTVTLLVQKLIQVVPPEDEDV